MSEWIKIIIVAPEPLAQDASELERCLSTSEASRPAFGSLEWQDGDGNRYAAMAPLVRSDWVESATGLLQEPSWGADMEAASRAQEALSILSSDPVIPIQPDRISVVVNTEFPLNVLFKLGLTHIHDKE
jgi:hypothetical protein